MACQVEAAPPPKERFERTVRIFFQAYGTAVTLNLRTGEEKKLSKRVMAQAGVAPMLLEDGRLLSTENDYPLLIDGKRLTIQEIAVSDGLGEVFLRFGTLFLRLLHRKVSVYKLLGDTLVCQPTKLQETEAMSSRRGILYLCPPRPGTETVWKLEKGELKQVKIEPLPGKRLGRMVIFGDEVWYTTKGQVSLIDQAGKRTPFHYAGFPMEFEDAVVLMPGLILSGKRGSQRLWHVEGGEVVMGRFLRVDSDMEFSHLIEGETFCFESFHSIEKKEENKVQIYDMKGSLLLQEKGYKDCTLLPGMRVVLVGSPSLLINLATGERMQLPEGGPIVRWVLDRTPEEGERVMQMVGQTFGVHLTRDLAELVGRYMD